ncbi:MAG: cyclic nucleotide-binding domain-containing protein [Acidobacteria bacterium]|nr:cyclic nucleotide-binding domain-containing protein [Acidobacteriota bacterium]
MATAFTQPIPTTALWEDPLALLPRRKPQSFEKDQSIFAPEDPADSLFLVVNGAIKISRFSDNGRETVLDVECCESFFGITSLLGEAERGEMATALEPSQVMEWSIMELRDLMARTPDLGPALMRMVARKLNEADERIESFAVDHIPRRLLKALLRLGERFGETQSDSEVHLMPLTHELLAKHVGTSREIVTQHMSQLRRRGVIDYSRSGLDFNPQRLRRELLQTK